MESKIILTRRDGIFKAVTYKWVQAELFLIY